jgi:hypothetical protein
MDWIRIEAGEYWSKDDRFQILKIWERIYNLHWLLDDRVKNKNYHCNSLKECKRQAEGKVVILAAIIN